MKHFPHWNRLFCEETLNKRRKRLMLTLSLCADPDIKSRTDSFLSAPSWRGGLLFYSVHRNRKIFVLSGSGREGIWWRNHVLTCPSVSVSARCVWGPDVSHWCPRFYCCKMRIWGSTLVTAFEFIFGFSCDHLRKIQYVWKTAVLWK